MDDAEPIDMTALRQKAIQAQAELTTLATLYNLAVRGVSEPATLTEAEVKMLAEGILRHVKPHIGRR